MDRSGEETSKKKGNSQIKQRLKGYGMILGYSLVGMFGLGFFAFKIIMIRQQNLALIKNKSRTPLMHSNMRNFVLGGIGSLTVYACGLSYLMERVPKSEANIQLGDNAELPLQDQMDSTMQEHYIFKTMRIFRVSEGLIEKAKKQFEEVKNNHPTESAKESLKGQNHSVNTEVFKSMWEKLKWQFKGKGQGK